MRQNYEYDFVRLGKGWFQVSAKSLESYQSVVRERAAQGWRLVQVFSPSVGVYGASKYIELIFERELE